MFQFELSEKEINLKIQFKGKIITSVDLAESADRSVTVTSYGQTYVTTSNSEFRLGDIGYNDTINSLMLLTSDGWRVLE